MDDKNKSEGQTDVEGAETTPESKGQATEPAKQTDEELAKAKQQADQERANARRAREALAQAETQRDQLSEQVQELQTRLTDLDGRLKEQLTKKEYADLGNLDPEQTDVPQLVKAFQQATSKVAQLEKRVNDQDQFIREQTQRQQQLSESEARRQRTEEILSAVEEEIGDGAGKYRNEAVKLADELVDSGEVDQPGTSVQGYRLMRRCYKEIAEKHASKKTTKPVPTDTGLRGVSVPDKSDEKEFKRGTLDDVAADMESKMQAKTWKRAFASPG